MTLEVRTLFRSEHLSVFDIRCTADPSTPVTVEQFSDYSVSLVRRGSFSCACRGRLFELVPGSLLLGHPGDEFTCSHAHHEQGDECLSFHFSPQWSDQAGVDATTWRLGSLTPAAALSIAGRIGSWQGAGFDELGQWLLSKLALRAASEPRGHSTADTWISTRPGSRSTRPSTRDRSRAVDAALWIESNLAESLPLDELARRANLSALHFLRVFTRVVGVTPHQYLVGRRLQRAAGLLEGTDLPVTTVALESGFADLSNFIRSFARVFGVPPSQYRSETMQFPKLRSFHQVLRIQVPHAVHPTSPTTGEQHVRPRRNPNPKP